MSSASTPPLTLAAADAMAEKIAKDLFTDGGTRAAQHLVLEGFDGKSLGRWAFGTAKARIREQLLASMAGESK